MDHVALAYNLAMFAVDATALRALRRETTASVWLRTTACAAAVAALLALGLGGGSLTAVRLASYGIFLHGVLIAAASAWLLRRSQPVMAVGAAGVSLLLTIVAIDAFLIEPDWLEISHVRLDSEKLERPVRVAVVADLQTDQFGEYEKETFRRLLQEKPDIVLLAGDYFQASPAKENKLRRQTNVYLRSLGLSAPCGIFAVRGNVDSDGWQEAFEGLPVRTAESTRSYDLGNLQVTCLGMRDSFNSGLHIGPASSAQFHIVLGHSPNYALGQIGADLLVAGHTHGGQVRLPGIGPLVTSSEVPRQWAAGLTDLPSGGKLIVSRGIGMERDGAPRLRFFCRPQLVLIDLVPKESD